MDVVYYNDGLCSKEGSCEIGRYPKSVSTGSTAVSGGAAGVAARGETRRYGGSGVKVQPRRVLHVRSISEWAPACIGPYSQANTIHSNLLFIAGQIPLNPGTMALSCPMSPSRQMAITLDHCQAVLRAVGSELKSVSLFVVYYQVPEDRRGSLSSLELIETAFRAEKTQRFPENQGMVIFLEVPRIPRDAMVEIQVVAQKSTSQLLRKIKLKAEDSSKMFGWILTADACRTKGFQSVYSMARLPKETTCDKPDNKEKDISVRRSCGEHEHNRNLKVGGIADVVIENALKLVDEMKTVVDWNSIAWIKVYRDCGFNGDVDHILSCKVRNAIKVRIQQQQLPPQAIPSVSVIPSGSKSLTPGALGFALHLVFCQDPNQVEDRDVIDESDSNDDEDRVSQRRVVRRIRQPRTSTHQLKRGQYVADDDSETDDPDDEDEDEDDNDATDLNALDLLCKS
mmetsp:Transcript_21492/g.41724  ORF Transcript_21492/g.41724 Transcript_21492/m.41724 type:complete len:454 (-) Transcript_21492:88-1449(-)